MAIEDRVEATAKNIEGKAQETFGEATGDPQAKAEGKAKQVEAAAQHQKENIKDNMKESIDRV